MTDSSVVLQPDLQFLWSSVDLHSSEAVVLLDLTSSHWTVSPRIQPTHLDYYHDRWLLNNYDGNFGSGTRLEQWWWWQIDDDEYDNDENDNDSKDDGDNDNDNNDDDDMTIA